MRPIIVLAFVWLCAGCDQSRAVVGDAVGGELDSSVVSDLATASDRSTPPGPPIPQDWGRSLFDGNDDDYATAVAVEPGGGVYLLGVFKGVLEIAQTSLTSAGSYDIYVVALTAAGKLRWARRLGGPEDPDCEIHDLAVAPSRDVFVAGVTTRGGGDYTSYLVRLATQ
jgi:hypothetical protein